MQVSLQKFLSLRTHLPVIDVRSQGEFAAGHIHNAINVPLLTDEERVVVGTTYKLKGQQDAISEGFRLVNPRLEGMIAEAVKVANGKDVLVHCWRGGMRSSYFSQFIETAGIQSRMLEGGYKSYRLAALNSFKAPKHLIALTGCTGSGKSEVLRELARQGEQVIDLEAMAHHKGSAFGGLLQPPQPTTEQFQNDLFEHLLSLDTTKPIWVEDESIAIGKIFLPVDFWNQMNQSLLVQMDVRKDTRVERLVLEYGPSNREEFLSIMTKVSKKLGGQNFLVAKEKLALNDMASVIDILLTYYDKAYMQSIAKRKNQLSFTMPWDGKDARAYAEELIRHLHAQTARV